VPLVHYFQKKAKSKEILEAQKSATKIVALFEQQIAWPG